MKDKLRSLKMKLFGTSGFSMGFQAAFVSYTIIFYFTEILGISVVTTSAIFSGGAAVALFTYPVINAMIDTSKPARFGAVRKWFLIFIVLMAIGYLGPMKAWRSAAFTLFM